MVALAVKNPFANAGDLRDEGSIPGLGKMLQKKKWQPTPVFLPGESQGRASLVGFRLRGRAESDTTEVT